MTDRLWALVPAAGSGSRMGAPIPKQYLPLGSSSVLNTTIDKLLQLPNLAGLVITLAEHDVFFPLQPTAHHPLVNTTLGGAERADSVCLGLEFLLKHQQASFDDWVLVHDAARPCVLISSILHLISSVTSVGRGGILAVPVADTLKRECSGLIVETVPRQDMWQAQTPQMFRLGPLLHALGKALAVGSRVTDEASAMELAGEQPQLILGRRDNIKITQPEDLALAEAILNSQADIS